MKPRVVSVGIKRNSQATSVYASAHSLLVFD